MPASTQARKATARAQAQAFQHPVSGFPNYTMSPPLLGIFWIKGSKDVVCEKEKNRVKADIFQVVDRSSFFLLSQIIQGFRLKCYFCAKIYYFFGILKYI